MSRVDTQRSADHVALFQERSIRRTWHGDQWWFAIVDVVAVLSESVQSESYIKDLRRRDKDLAKGWGQIATPLRVAIGPVGRNNQRALRRSVDQQRTTGRLACSASLSVSRRRAEVGAMPVGYCALRATDKSSIHAPPASQARSQTKAVKGKKGGKSDP
ncbi:MAG: hypothetical protein ACT4NL_09095 [Pseudomarimonas sp.]